MGHCGAGTGAHPPVGEAESWGYCQPTGQWTLVLGSLVAGSGVPRAGISLMVGRAGSKKLAAGSQG